LPEVCADFYTGVLGNDDPSSVCSECEADYENFIIPFNSVTECQSFICTATCDDCDNGNLAEDFPTVYSDVQECRTTECPILCSDCAARWEEMPAEFSSVEECYEINCFASCSQFIHKIEPSAQFCRPIDEFYSIIDTPLRGDLYTNRDGGDIFAEDEATDDKLEDPEFYCTTTVEDGGNQTFELASCPFHPSSCGLQNEFIMTNGQSQTLELTDLTHDMSNVCTYKISSDNGAPGFNLESMLDGETFTSPGDSDSTRPKIAVSFIEYDLDLIEAFLDSTWPSNQMDAAHSDCAYSACRHGSLYARKLPGTDRSIPASEIMLQIQAKEMENELYYIKQRAVNDYNAANAGGTFEDAVFGGEDGLLRDIPIPTLYDGPSLENTESMGGFGFPTFGDYSIHNQKWSGYQSFGVLGQGTRDDLAISLDGEDKTRIMVVVLEHTWYWTIDNEEEFVNLEVGSYEWRDRSLFNLPARPDPQMVGDNAARMSLSALFALVVLMFVY